MNRGHRTADVAVLAGATYRQVDHWARTGVLVPAVEARGSGSSRTYTTRQVQVAWALHRLSQLSYAANDTQARQRVALELEHAPDFTGWLVCTDLQAVIAVDLPALAEMLAQLGTAAAVVPLDRCPVQPELEVIA